VTAQTEYLVLIRSIQPGDTEGPLWREVEKVSAASADAAIKAVAGETDGEYVATPTRSWQPVPVKVEKKLIVRLGESA
jgi:hypothetical protein